MHEYLAILPSTLANDIIIVSITLQTHVPQSFYYAMFDPFIVASNAECSQRKFLRDNSEYCE